MSDEAKDLQIKLAETEAKLAQFEASAATQLQEAVTSAVASERQRAVSILSTSKTLKIGFDTALAHVEKGHSTEMSLEIMTAVAEATDAQKVIDPSASAATVQTDDGVNLNDSANKIAMMKAAYKKQLGMA